MNKKIDLIIPCYNTHDTLYRLFGSIMEQTFRDEMHIIMVDDCSDETYDDFVRPFKDILDIEIVRMEQNGGPGIARRIGMQTGKSPYIMFIDSDDTFFNTYSVKNLYDKIENTKANVVHSNFLEEGDKQEFYPHINDNIWVFGKIFRRQFLENLEIYFNDTRSNEDVGFNELVRCFTEIEFLDEFTYVWHFQPKSITRKNNGIYSFTCVEGHIKNIIWAWKEAEKKGWKKEYLEEASLGQLLFYYFDYFKYDNYGRKEIDINKYLLWVARFYRAFEKEIENGIKKDTLKRCYKNNFINYYDNFDNIYIPTLTIYEFIEKLKTIEINDNEEWGMN